MSRLEFMKQLARLLDDLPREEKIEILKYYNGYFDDAGEEKEAEVITQLGSPEQVAAEVKAGMGDVLDEKREEEVEVDVQENAATSEETASSYDAYGYQTAEQAERTESVEQADVQQSQRKASARSQKKNGLTTLLIVILLIVTFRFWFGLLAGAFGLAFGLIGLLVGLVGSVIGCIVGGVAMLTTVPLNGMLMLAVGIFLMGLLLLVGMLVGLVFGKLIPKFIEMIRKLFAGFREALNEIMDGITGRR